MDRFSRALVDTFGERKAVASAIASLMIGLLSFVGWASLGLGAGLLLPAVVFTALGLALALALQNTRGSRAGRSGLTEDEGSGG